MKNPKGFKGSKNELHNRKYSEREFRRGIKRSYISVKTQKGLEFLKGND